MDPAASLRRDFAKGLIGALAAGFARAQDKPPTPADSPSFSVDVRLVQVGFSVRDPANRLVPGMEKADFEVYESGQKQQIRLFSREEAMPLSLALIIDRSGSQDSFEHENIHAAITFFRSILRPRQDTAMVSAFGVKIKLIQAPTPDLDALETSLKQMIKNYGRAPWVGPEVNRSGGSAVIDAAYWTCRDKLADVQGRKAVIMIGDGRDNASQVAMTELIDFLQANDILFYGLDNGGEDSKENRRLRNLMPVVAAETGGRVFQTGQVPLREAFAQIEQELRTLYTLGYASTNTERDGRYRKIEIRPLNRELSVRARPGYYAR